MEQCQNKDQVIGDGNGPVRMPRDDLNELNMHLNADWFDYETLALFPSILVSEYPAVSFCCSPLLLLLLQDPVSVIINQALWALSLSGREQCQTQWKQQPKVRKLIFALENNNPKTGGMGGRWEKSGRSHYNHSEPCNHKCIVCPSACPLINFHGKNTGLDQSSWILARLVQNCKWF